MKNRTFVTAALAATMLVGSLGVAGAAVTFDADSGEGFVGKGDVQVALGWNNKQLQDGADDLVFAVSAVTETTWDCFQSTSGQTRERNNTVTTQGVVSSTARLRNQITGFNLTGYSEGVTTVVEGQATNTCPGANTTYVEGSTQVGEASELTLTVNGVELG